MKEFVRRLVFLAAVLAFISPAFAAEYPKLNLRFAHYVSSELPQSEVDKWWAKEIEKRSDGRIKIQFFWSESLAKANELVELIGNGGVQLGSTAASYYPSKLPLSGLPSALPLTFENEADAQRVASRITTEPAIIEENARNGLHMLYWHTLPTYRILCRQPVGSVADLKGLKVRAPGEFIPKLWTSLGATSVNALSPEVYEGLQRGNLDCAFWPPDFMSAYKLYEAGKYLSSAKFGAIVGWPVWVNKKTWDSWPENVRQLFTEVSKEAAARDVEIVSRGGEQAMQAMEKHLTVVDFQDEERMRQLAPDFLKLWEESMVAKGLGEPARTLVDAAREAMQR